MKLFPNEITIISLNLCMYQKSIKTTEVAGRKKLLAADLWPENLLQISDIGNGQNWRGLISSPLTTSHLSWEVIPPV